jgi:hypothetical protein
MCQSITFPAEELIVRRVWIRRLEGSNKWPDTKDLAGQLRRVQDSWPSDRAWRNSPFRESCVSVYKQHALPLFFRRMWKEKFGKVDPVTMLRYQQHWVVPFLTNPSQSLISMTRKPAEAGFWHSKTERGWSKTRLQHWGVTPASRGYPPLSPTSPCVWADTFRNFAYQ